MDKMLCCCYTLHYITSLSATEEFTLQPAFSKISLFSSYASTGVTSRKSEKAEKVPNSYTYTYTYMPYCNTITANTMKFVKRPQWSLPQRERVN
jgi:hypothetical protein